MADALTKADYVVLRDQNNNTLAEWWSILNRWEWPNSLPDKEPRDLSDDPNANDRRHRIMAYIVRRVGKLECLHKWNTT